MRYIILVKATESGEMPNQELMGAVASYTDELAKAGALRRHRSEAPIERLANQVPGARSESWFPDRSPTRLTSPATPSFGSTAARKPSGGRRAIRILQVCSPPPENRTGSARESVSGFTLANRS
jgi:hypothetical protein